MPEAMATEPKAVRGQLSHPVLNSEATMPVATTKLLRLVSTSAGERKRAATTVRFSSQHGHRRLRKISDTDVEVMQWAKKSQPLKTRKVSSSSH